MLINRLVQREHLKTGDHARSDWGASYTSAYRFALPDCCNSPISEQAFQCFRLTECSIVKISICTGHYITNVTQNTALMPLQHSKAAKRILACGENHIIIKKRYRDFIEISENNRWLYLNACISQTIEVMKTCLPQSCLLKSWIENKIEIGLISESVLTKSMDSCILTGHFNCTVWKRCWRTKKTGNFDKYHS